MDTVPSSNDIKLSARDAVNYLANQFGPIPDERRSGAEKMLANLIYDYPPLGPDEGPCNHGYENKHWCARCGGKVDEKFMPVETAPNTASSGQKRA